MRPLLGASCHAGRSSGASRWPANQLSDGLQQLGDVRWAGDCRRLRQKGMRRIAGIQNQGRKFLLPEALHDQVPCLVQQPLVYDDKRRLRSIRRTAS